jgi:primosomal replication protein N''
MVTDISARLQVLEHVRAQTGAFAAAHDPARLQGEREILSARLQALEGELDRLHEATYRVDAISGMSHRQIMGELICLAGESERAAKNSLPREAELSALRARFADMPRAEFERRRDRCAAAARHWRAARFEKSPLHVFRPFDADQEVCLALRQAAQDLAAREAAHQKIVSEYPQALPLSAGDFGRFPAWRKEHANMLTQTPNALWQKFARWRPLFEGSGEARIIADYETLTRHLESLPWKQHSPRFSPALEFLDDARLARMIRFCQKEIAGSWLVNPFGFLRRARLRRFLRENGGMGEKAQFRAEISELLRAAQLERQCRPLRQRLFVLRRALGEPEVAQESLLELKARAANDLSALREVQRRALAIQSAPAPETARAAALEANPENAMRVFLARLDGGFLRHNAMTKSLEALDALTPWMKAETLEELRRRIRAHKSFADALAAISAALPTLFAFQDFRARIERGELDADDLALLAPLRALDAQLAGWTDAELEAAVRRIFWYAACLVWRQRLERADPVLCLARAEIAQKTAALAEADGEILRLNQEWLARDLEKGALAAPKAWQDITRLRGARALSLRDFVARGIPLGLLRLVPVWLMNPDAASRILPQKAGLFDVVIYDEASQMPVEYAVPTLYRARAAVVSGDEKQMPPAAFFSARADIDETPADETPDMLDECAAEPDPARIEAWDQREIKDCPDLLQLARAVLPRTTLRIHYRSVYRELIAFSNAAFYENALHVPARHPEARIRAHAPVELIRVDGLYQEQTNAEEARRVADWLADFWRESGNARPSVGIVTFNEKQAEQIEAALEARAAEDPAFCAIHAAERERKDREEDMSLFVKNVENVQGDERDVILFSTTFGRNALGAFRRNFGVLGQTGGERRLNVAITRARQKVALMTSMPIRDISDFLDTHRPPAGPRDYLQAYLEYARLLSENEFLGAKRLLDRLDSERQIRFAATRARENADRFRTEVETFLRARGWQPETPEAEDAFGVDFAIEDPKTGLFALGIECDTPQHPLLARARAREIWRPSVLRRAIPHVHRVSSRAWLLDGQKERALLEEALQRALGAEETARDNDSINTIQGESP